MGNVRERKISVTDVDKVCSMRLATFEAFRRLGFQSENVFFAFNGGRPVTILRAQGLQFAVGYPQVPQLTCDERSFTDEWMAWAEAWNHDMTEEERQAIYRSAIVDSGMAAPLVLALKARGFVLSSDNGLTN